jgi:hypothetical protein
MCHCAVCDRAGVVAHEETTINGIPVIGSGRGGICETLGESGFLLSLPERLTPVSEIVPTADESIRGLS